jgi:hypothetical protein
MTIRFLQTVPSENPEWPFMAGQVIDVPAPSPSMQDALRNGTAELVKAEDERGEAPAVEIPEPVRRKGRKHVH